MNERFTARVPEDAGEAFKKSVDSAGQILHNIGSSSPTASAPAGATAPRKVPPIYRTGQGFRR